MEMRINLDVHNELSEPFTLSPAAEVQSQVTVSQSGCFFLCKPRCGAGKDERQRELDQQPEPKVSVYNHVHSQKHFFLLCCLNSRGN